MLNKSIIILSGGLDSTVSAFLAAEESTISLAITFDYGQRAAHQEIKAGAYWANQLGTKHRVIVLDWLRDITTSSLVAKDQDIPHLDPSELDLPQKTIPSAKAVWVPNRNGLFINIAACFAETLSADIIVTGFNAEEAATFSDNSVEFIQSSNHFLSYSTLKKPIVKSYVAHLDKKAILQKSQDIPIDLRQLWFCYESGLSPCRQCESCLRFFRALREAGLADPF